MNERYYDFSKAEVHLGFYARYVKRVFDFCIALGALMLLWPVLLVVAILVRCNMGSPVIFKQERPGRYEKIFYCYKFRTMTDERDENGELLEEAKRLTKFGLWLRKTSLDELPELINLLRGDMSLIGPRPLLTKYLPYYHGDEHLRHFVRPGMTGWAQVHGRNYIQWDKRFAKDVEYVRNLTFSMDVKIFFMTFKSVFAKEGIASDPNQVEIKLEVLRADEREEPIAVEEERTAEPLGRSR